MWLPFLLLWFSVSFLCFGIKGLLFFAFAWVLCLWLGVFGSASWCFGCGFFVAQPGGAMLLLSLSLGGC